MSTSKLKMDHKEQVCNEFEAEIQERPWKRLRAFPPLGAAAVEHRLAAARNTRGGGLDAEEASAALEVAVAQRNSRVLRPALAGAQAAHVDQATIRHAKLLLRRLEAAEADALAALKAAKCNDLPQQYRRLVVLDFDRTISKEHLWATFRDAPLHAITVNNGTFVDLEAFQAFVGGIRELGHHIAVATFGRKDVAGKAMSFALGDDHGIPISTPADFEDPSCSPPHEDSLDTPVLRCPEGSSYLGNKNRQLAALAGKFGVSAAEIILLDDDAHNIREAVRAGVIAQHTPSGLTRAVLSKVGKAIGLPASLLKFLCPL